MNSMTCLKRHLVSQVLISISFSMFYSYTEANRKFIYIEVYAHNERAL